MSDLTDWTDGHEALTYQICQACSERWYFHRDFCPHCGSTQVGTHVSASVGVVHAVTVVVRAPSPEWREHAPYGLALIDLDEAVRVMTHAQIGLEIGDRVRVDFVRLGERLVPLARPSINPNDGQ
jgi:uncharacterized OB-fold protein